MMHGSTKLKLITEIRVIEKRGGGEGINSGCSSFNPEIKFTFRSTNLRRVTLKSHYLQRYAVIIFSSRH